MPARAIGYVEDWDAPWLLVNFGEMHGAGRLAKPEDKMSETDLIMKFAQEASDEDFQSAVAEADLQPDTLTALEIVRSAHRDPEFREWLATVIEAHNK